jgi:hypothetical protein
MSCDWVRENIPECLAGTLDKPARAVVIEHIETCARCRAELGELGVVWRGLESQTLTEPDPRMRTRFQGMLDVYQEAYQAGLKAAAQTVPALVPRKSWWPVSPVWRLAGAFALLVAGVLSGRFLDRVLDRGSRDNTEMSALRGQVEGLRQLVALSLLNEQSPSSRLQGVTYSVQMSRPDTQVVQALLRAVTHDPNISVRLSVVDALEKYSGDPEVRRALVDAIAVQDSPLVQVALIDLLAQIRDQEAAPVLRKLAADSQADDTTRQHATLALQRMAAPKGADK